MKNMTVSQLSIFIENSNGTLLRVLDVLRNAGIQLMATTIADTSDYGICRIICDYPMKAVSALKEAGLAAAVSEVFALADENRPGAAVGMLKRFQRENQNLPYLYSFMAGDKYILVFRCDNPEKCREIILREGLIYLTDEDLPKYCRLPE